MLCESMNCIYLDVQEDFVDSFKFYKYVEVLEKRMDKCLSLWQENQMVEGVLRSLEQKDVILINENKISCFYTNARSKRNKFVKLKSYVSLEKPSIIFITETWVKIFIQNNKGIV